MKLLMTINVHGIVPNGLELEEMAKTTVMMIGRIIAIVFQILQHREESKTGARLRVEIVKVS